METKKRNAGLVFLTDVYQCAAREMRTIFGDIGVMTFLFLLPLAYPLLYTFIYNNETVRDVPVVVVDHASSPLSRDFIRRADASPDLKVAYRGADMKEARELLAHKKAYGIVYIPADFEKNTVRGNKSHVSLYCDMSSLLYYKAMLGTLTDVSLEVGRELQLKQLGELSRQEARAASIPVENQWTVLFNIHSGFAAFLIPAILMIILQQTMLLGIGMTTGTARQQHDMRQIITSARGNVATSMLGRCAAYMILYTAIAAYMIEIVPGIFSVPRIGDTGTKILFLAPFLLACAFFSMFLSTALHTRESCMPAFVFTSVPFLFISGVSWPAAAVPGIWKFVGWFVPSTSGVQGFIKINTMGADLADVRFEYLSLWALAVLYGGLTYLAYSILKRRYGLGKDK